MSEKHIEIGDVISDEYLEKLGMTRDEFRGSRVELLLQAMLDSSIELIHEESLALMQQYSLTYAEAQSIVINNLLKQKRGLKMTNKNKIKCPECGETENIIKNQK